MPRVTMADVARKAGLSKNAVSLALRHDPQIPEATRRRVSLAAAELGYAVNPAVSRLMSEMRSWDRTHHTLAILNAFPSRDALRWHPTIPTYVAGCRLRAQAQGYGIDTFWLHDPELTGTSLNRILSARGIRGVIVVGTMDNNQLPERFQATWEQHACVVTGVRTHQPTLSFCCVDHHALVLQAAEQARLLGYRRPALVIDSAIDRLVENRFSAGMWVGQQALPPDCRLPGFYDVEAARNSPELFHAWLKREQPDVIFTLYNVVRRWIEATGLRVPDDIGLIQLERRADNQDWAGMDQHNNLAGAAAVDLVISLMHHNETGIPQFPLATLIGATWVPGTTVRPQKPAAPAKRRAKTKR